MPAILNQQIVVPMGCGIVYVFRSTTRGMKRGFGTTVEISAHVSTSRLCVHVSSSRYPGEFPRNRCWISKKEMPTFPSL